MNHKVGKVTYKLFLHGVLHWVNFSRKKHKTTSLLTLCESRNLCSIHSETRGRNLLIMSRFDPLKELCSVILLFLGFFIKTQIKSNNEMTNAYFIRFKKLGVNDYLSISAMCFFYISIYCVSKYDCFIYCKFTAWLENKIIIFQSTIFNGILVHIANRKNR